MACVKDHLSSEDPLSNKAMEFLINYQEEDDLVDYKLTFSPDEMHWLELTKDIMAFANTNGGYLVYGIKDGTYELHGLDQPTTEILLNINLIQQKVNRHIEPHLTMVRSKRFERKSTQFVIFFVPESLGLTHIVKSEGKYQQGSGNYKVILRPGIVFCRNSGTNAILNAQGFNSLVKLR